MSSDPHRGGPTGGSGGDSGGAGSVRAAGGKFAEREAALENEYFFKLVRVQSHLNYNNKYFAYILSLESSKSKIQECSDFKLALVSFSSKLSS